MQKYIKILVKIKEEGLVKTNIRTFRLYFTLNNTKKVLNSLVNCGLIELNVYNQKVTYSITKRGLSVLNFFGVSKEPQIEINNSF